MRVLAIDLGARRIGLALSDPTGTVARPWRTLESRGSIEEDAASIASIIDELHADDDGLSAAVVGLPVRLDGSPNDQTPRTRAFAARLAARVRTPIVLQDERLTSREAERRLALGEKDWRRRKEKLDAAAAAVILEDYLASAERGGGR
jgi:putative Holliday junction resolvase